MLCVARHHERAMGTERTLRLTAALFATLFALHGAACLAPEEPDDGEEEGVDGPEPTGDRGDPVSSGSVSDAAAQSCTTSSVLGLSQQIIAEANCIQPGAYAEVPSRSNLTVKANVFAYMQTPARDALVKALDAKPSTTMTVNSMLRTVAQQYLLYRWYQQGKCGIGLAAKPGKSNHETGLALDINEYSTWKSTMSGKGFTWLGSGDPPHFDYTGSGKKSYAGVDVQAFQRLWNRNHPEDLIGEDGSWGPQTEARMKKAPAAGFTKGATCGGPIDDTPDDPPPASSCAHATCEVGAALTNGCDACVSAICGVDVYCCNTTWDATCVGEVATVCGSTCDAQPKMCGAFEGKSAFTCAGDGASRGRCVNGALEQESCANGCLITASGEDVCMGTTSTWSCSGSYGTAKAENGDYYTTAFGCWIDDNGNHQSDSGDNCIPSCIEEANADGLCAGMSGKVCEETVKWYAADAARFGCLARLKLTNPKNNKSVVVVALDYGPSCTIEKTVSKHVMDLSNPTENYLFGGPTSASEKALVHVVEVDASTPLGPI